MVDAERKHESHLADIKLRRQELEREERAARTDFVRQSKTLRAALDRARRQFSEKLEAWAAREDEANDAS